jgi:hypothetical protein
MVWLGVKRLGKKLGFKKTDTETLGFVENIFVKIADRMGMKTAEIIFPELNENDQAYIVRLFGENKVKEYRWINNGIFIIFRENFLPYSVRKINNLIVLLSDYFKSKYSMEHKCQNCGKNNTGEIYYTKDGSKYLCGDCLNDIESELYEERVNYDQIPSNYFIGFLGSMLFSIPGILLTVIFFIFLKNIASVSALLYVFLAKIGYEKFKGKLTWFGSMIISFSGIVMTVIGIIISYVVLIISQTKTFNKLFEIMQMPEIQRELSINIISALFLSLIVIVINFLQIRKDWPFPKIKKAKEM